jgi:hypothetical protein
MAKLILFSVILATIAIPLIAARERNPVRGLKKAIWYAVLFNAAYALALLFVYPRIL